MLRRLDGKKVFKAAIFSILGIAQPLRLVSCSCCAIRGYSSVYSLTQGDITLYSDEPIASRAAEQVLKEAEQRLARSPLFRPRSGAGIRVYICNRRWRFILFANFKYQRRWADLPTFKQ